MKSKIIRSKKIKKQVKFYEKIHKINEYEKPKSRSDCPKYRPCCFISCKYNLYLDVTDCGSIKINFPVTNPEQMIHSCVLDLAKKGPMTLDEIGEKMNITKERCRQIIDTALEKIKNNKSKKLLDFYTNEGE